MMLPARVSLKGFVLAAIFSLIHADEVSEGTSLRGIEGPSRAEAASENLKNLENSETPEMHVPDLENLESSGPESTSPPTSEFGQRPGSESKSEGQSESESESESESLVGSGSGSSSLRGGRRLATADKDVHCACRAGAGALRCVRMFYSLLQCNPLCAALCAGQGMQFEECSGSRSRLWHARLHVRYTPCV
mmetsp:Transcript_44265/g.94976  ORF Transcript_44265/g.94976 Transcript_44265/m.94976 type:complete len:192 (-) Transcript_44265:584-1159(-)